MWWDWPSGSVRDRTGEASSASVTGGQLAAQGLLQQQQPHALLKWHCSFLQEKWELQLELFFPAHPHNSHLSDSQTTCYTCTCPPTEGGRLQFLWSITHCPASCAGFKVIQYPATITLAHVITPLQTALWELILGSLSAPAQGDPSVTSSSAPKSQSHHSWFPGQ